MLTISNFRKSYHEHIVLQISSLAFAEGVHWIQGENGSGKSTFFKSIAGIIPFEGDVVLGGINIKAQPRDYRKIVNYSEAEPFYPGFVTPKDLMRFTGRAKGSSAQQQDELISHFQIHPYFHQPCDTLSSGTLKKLSLALAFIGNPSLVILDEPLITLDATSREKLLVLIRLAVKSRAVVLISSHQTLDASDLQIVSTHKILSSTLHHV